MARPTKITEEKKLKLADFIRAGLTIKDACYGVDISPSTFNRLRAKDMEFDKLIVEATKGSWSNAEALAKYHYRGYKRKIPIQHLISSEDTFMEPVIVQEERYPTVSNTSVRENSKTFLGLPVRLTYPTERPSNYYYNGNTKRVERFTRDGILQSMSANTWRRKYLGVRDEPLFFGTVF